jgi:hypothetical protein
MLSPGERAVFDVEERLLREHESGTKDSQATAGNPAEIVDTDPLFLPYVLDRRVYVAAVGHFTVGWRVFADWSVQLAAMEDGLLVPRAAFAVGMWKAHVRNVSIRPIGAALVTAPN